MTRLSILLHLFIVARWQLLVWAAGTEHHPVPTYFGRKHKNGTLVDRSSPEYNAEIESVPRVDKILREDESVLLQAWPDNVKNGEKITVLWSDLLNHQPKDFIAYYCPYYDSTNHYLDWFYVNTIPGFERGYGHVKHTVYNMREPCVFKLYRQVFKTPDKKSYYYQLAATSNKINFADGGPYAPLQGHIACTNKPTEMRVMWTSSEVIQPPVVRYGQSKHLDMHEVAHLTHTYTADSMCQSTANTIGFWHPGITYDFLLQNLEPNTMYYYSYGTEDYMSKIANFTTPLPKGDLTPFKYIIYGDMGVEPYPEATTTAILVRREIEENDVKFVFHIGDISYARGYAYIWEQWAWLIEPYASLIPYMVGIGNHEYDYTSGGLGRDPSNIPTDYGWKPIWFNGGHDSNGECGVPMHKRYHMPDNGNSVFWYSYDYGMVHMIMMSTEHDYSPGSPQYIWLEKDLMSVDRTLTPWLFIGGHRPMYNSQIFLGDYVVATHMQELFEDLLYAYKVDIAFWAHYHSYERTCKLYKNACVDDGVIHITVGTAGMGANYQGWYQKEWSLVRIMDYGYGRVTAANSSALLFELVINRHNEVQDHVWLYK